MEVIAVPKRMPCCPTGKPEAGLLFLVTPALLLGHLTGWVPEGGQKAMLLCFTGLFGVFAARKYSQPVKDDLGDKSVFEVGILHHQHAHLRFD